MALQPKPFSLDVVLNYRKRLEDLAKNRFFEAKKTHASIEEKLAEEKLHLNALIDECTQLQATGVEITKLILFEENITSNKNNVAAITKNLEEKKKLVDQAQEVLLMRSQEFQVMERLKNEQNAAWRKHLSKKEAAMLDEIAIMRHGKDVFDNQ